MKRIIMCSFLDVFRYYGGDYIDGKSSTIGSRCTATKSRVSCAAYASALS